MVGRPACRMDRLLELTALAERSHFWFRGFRWFLRPMVARAVASRPNGRILDCGCGTGSNLRMLEPFGEVYGFDVTWRGLQFAHEHGRRRIAQASIASIPFQTATFDLVTSFDVFQCLPDPVEGAAVREMARVLKPGGAAVFNFAALEVLRGSHSVLAEEVRRYTPGQVTATARRRRARRRAPVVCLRQSVPAVAGGAGRSPLHRPQRRGGVGRMGDRGAVAAREHTAQRRGRCRGARAAGRQHAIWFINNVPGAQAAVACGR